MEQKPWNGVEFMDKFIALAEEGLKCMKQDHAEQRGFPLRERQVAYSEKNIAACVVMYITACHRMAMRSNIDQKAYAEALKAAREKAEAQNATLEIIRRIIKGA